MERERDKSKSGKHHGTVLDAKDGYQIVDCMECGFAHAVPVPSQDELDRIYKEEYYTLEKPLFIERQLEDLPWWNIVYDERYDFLEKNLFPAAVGGHGKKMLDIGCGPGFFLKRGRERGWDVCGVEPSLKASGYAREVLGLDVINAFPEGQLFLFLSQGGEERGRKQKQKMFDAVNLSEVLEHVPDPVSLCKKAFELLAPGGMLCVAVPNDYNPLQKMLREKMDYGPYWVAPPHHINYFSFDSLKRLLMRCGFELAGETAVFPMEFFLLMGDNYVGDDPLGRLCHAKRKRFDMALSGPDLSAFRKEFYGLLARHGMGREAVLYGRKAQ